MTKFGFLSLTIGLLILTDLGCWGTATGADEETLRQRVDQLAQPYLDNKLIVGMTIGVLHDGKQEVFGYGRMSRNDPRVPDGDTIYELGGVCKVLTGILLADAVIQGHARLDQPAGELLPVGVKMPVKGDRAITLLDLSTHVSGLPRIPNNMKNADRHNPYANYSENDLYAFLNSHRLSQAPGTKNSYSNLGAGLLGHLLSLQARSTYEELVWNRIAAPLGMSSTKVTIDKEWQSRFAPGHRDGQPAANWDVPVLAGAGSLRSTVNDMLLFAAANLTPREDTLGKAMEMAWTIHQPPIEKKDSAMGLGWHLMPDGTHWHNGQTGGYHSMILVDRKSKSSVVLMTNTATLRADELAADIMKTLSGAKIPQRKFEKPIHSFAEELQKFVGSYELAPDTISTVESRPTSHPPEGNRMLESWAGAVIIASVVFAFAIYHTSTAWFAHRERMAMIERGLDPDSGQPPPR